MLGQAIQVEIVIWEQPFDKFIRCMTKREPGLRRGGLGGEGVVVVADQIAAQHQVER